MAPFGIAFSWWQLKEAENPVKCSTLRSTFLTAPDSTTTRMNCEPGFTYHSSLTTARLPHCVVGNCGPKQSLSLDFMLVSCFLHYLVIKKLIHLALSSLPQSRIALSAKTAKEMILGQKPSSKFTQG